MRKKILWFVIVLTTILIILPGCNYLENKTTSGSRLVLKMITGTDLNGNTGSNTIFSDVITTSGTIFNDNATAQMTAALLDPLILPSDATEYQTVVIDRIKIEYSRTDGLSEPGKDIPYSFTQDVHVAIRIGETVTFPFVLVSHTAKMEPPLVDLRYSNEVYRMEARITFYGEDLGGHRVVPVVGSISVWFANFGDND
jgi:hypothetical protein